MADHYTLPDDVTQLGDDELEENLTAAVRSFQAVSSTTVVTPQTLPALRSLKASIDTLKEEQAARQEAAESAAAEIDQLSAEVFGETEAEPVAEAEPEAEPVAEAEPEVVEPTAVVTASARRAQINLSAVRARQTAGGGLSRYLPAEADDTVTITAAVDVPGFRPGQDFQMGDVTEGVIRRASALKTAGGGTGLVASFRLPFQDDLIVKDASASTEGATVAMRAADQRRLSGDNLVASGGWCAPSETLYDLINISCPEMLWDLPEIQLARGGLRYFKAPVLDVTALTWVHTEQDDIAGNTKPCYKIPCPTPTEVRAEAQGVCIESGILTQRFFPELVELAIQQAMTAHEIRLFTSAYDKARLASTQVTTTVSAGTFSAIYGAVALQAADMIERYNLCDTYSLEVVFPLWLRNAMLTDLSRRRGVPMDELDASVIQRAFDNLNVRVQWARGLTPDVPTNIGGATPAVAWPADVNFLIYPAGNWVLGRGPEVNLGAIQDSTKFSTNDYTALFMEEAVALIDRLGISRNVTVTICPNGSVGAEVAIACPTA